jgi:Domain of unknown function (DUF1963)
MHQSELSKARAPGIWFRRYPRKASTSKLGGAPTLPLDIEWPRQLETGTPLHFLAQVDLSHLPPTPLEANPNGPALPRSGVLFFFADMVEEMLWGENGGPFATTRVIFGNRAGPERSPPDDTPDVLHAFGEQGGGFETRIKVFTHAALLPHVIDTFGGVARFPDATDTYASSGDGGVN